VENLTQDSQEKIEEIKEIETELAAPSITEVILGYKVVDLGIKGLVHLHRPSFYVLEGADKVFASAKLKLLKDRVQELPIENELKKLYAERGVWSPEDETRQAFYRDKLVLIAKEIFSERQSIPYEGAGAWDENIPGLEAYLGNSTAEYMDYRTNKCAEYRHEYNILRDTYNELFSNTIESFANYDKQVYLAVNCYKNPNGTYVWATTEDLKNDDLGVFSTAVTECSKYLSGLDSNELNFFYEFLAGAVT
jgi:hypothetical protein